MGWRGQENRDADGASAEATASLRWIAGALLLAVLVMVAIIVLP